MNNYYNTRPPRKGVIILASMMLIAIFGLAVYSAYEQRTDLAHSVHVSPTSVHYGTVSTVRTQGLVVPMRSTAPLLSSGEIRSYAYSGHATMPKATSSGSGFKIHTTSSASVHSIGGGGAGGGGSMSGGSSFSSSSSKGLNYSGGSVSIPTLAVNSSILATSANAAEASAPLSVNTRQSIGPRRARPNDEDGEEGDWSDADAGDGDWWYKDEDGWRQPIEGETRFDPTLGYTVVWNSSTSSWVKGSEYEPGVPVGNTPWLWLVLLALNYGVIKQVYKKRNAI